MHKLLVMLVAAATLAGPISAQAEDRAWDDEEVAPRKIDPKKAADIRKLLEVTGSGALAKQTMAQMLPAMKQLVPQAPQSFWDEFLAEIDEQELVELIVPVYDRNLSHEDVKALLAFYVTPAGKRVIAAMPKIAQESMLSGQEWGKKIGRRVMRRAMERKLLEDEEEGDE